MVQTRSQPVLLVMADISGYTRFMVSHGKAYEHSHLVIAELLETVISEAEAPLVVHELEGDAVFMYAPKEGDGWTWDERRGWMFERILGLMQTFVDKQGELEAFSVCRCDACSTIGQLKLKLVLHSGEAMFTRTGTFNVLSGIDVITVHRLLKNSVEGDQYVLMTESARADLDLPEGLEIVEGEEHYDVGSLRTSTFFPKVESAFDPMVARRNFSDANASVQILRTEIRREYTDVANNVESGFHFNTGRAATSRLEYEDEWLEGVPETVIESFCGMGNPFSLGVLSPGERVVDVGSGAGMDSLIAARMVGAGGEVVGVDMTEAMLKKSQMAAGERGLTNVRFVEGFSESLPIEDGWADVIISNGVLNLSPDKRRALDEFYRILKPGGRLQIGDILVDKPVPEAAKRDIDLWTS